VEIDTKNRENGTKKENIVETLLRFVPEKVDKPNTIIMNITDAIPE
jgi:hypothetical protein